MSKSGILLVLGFIYITIASFFSKKGNPISSIHQFKAKTIDGEWLDFSSLKGKKILIVNTASNCGFTPQYKQLEELYQSYKNKNFVIVGFPCNQFGEQEPGSNSDIKNFCANHYGVTFIMMEKVNVKGNDISDVYKWLTTKELNGVESSSVKWNFQKYMIDEHGFYVDYVTSIKKPNCSKIINWIK